MRLVYLLFASMLLYAPSDPPVEGLGNPLSTYYPGREREKAQVWDVVPHEGRLYLAYGTTDTDLPNYPLYYDPLRNVWDAERGADGRPLVLWQEGVNPVRAIDGRLYFCSLDPNRDGTQFIRRERDGSWTIKPIGPDGHSRDVFSFTTARGERVVLQHLGRNDLGYPQMMISWDDGDTWTLYGQGTPAPGAPDAPDTATFFTFRGDLYFTSLPNFRAGDNRPFLNRFTGDRTRPFEVVQKDRARVVPGEGTNFSRALEIAGRLVYSSGGLYSTSDLTAEGTIRIPIPENHFVMDLEKVREREQEVLYALVVPYPHDETSSSRVLRSTHGLVFDEVLRVPGVYSGFAFHEGHFYFTRSGAATAHTLSRVAYRPER